MIAKDIFGEAKAEKYKADLYTDIRMAIYYLNGDIHAQDTGKPIKASLSLYRDVISVEFVNAMDNLPHVFLMPFKLLGIFFFTTFKYLEFRVNVSID